MMERADTGKTADGENGPLAGLRVLELPGIGPLPFACMVLADLGADVVRIDRPDHVGAPADHPLEASLMMCDPLGRSRRRIAIDLKSPSGTALLLELVEDFDVLVEGFRPGVAERLGVGPDVCRSVNPRLIYGRVTGWGRSGPLAQTAGHDITYLSLSGILDTIGLDGSPPVCPTAMVGDFAGGGMFLALGVLAALFERERSGQGQVVDSAVVDGSALLGVIARYFADNGLMEGPRGTNLLDGGSYFYRPYETADGRWISFGAVEKKFHDELLEILGLDPGEFQQLDREIWPDARERIAGVVRAGTRSEWERRFEGSDACFAPVLSLEEATAHPHSLARKAYVQVGDDLQARPSPRFDRTPPTAPTPTRPPGRDTRTVLHEAGLSVEKIEALLDEGVVAEPAHRNVSANSDDV